MGLKKCPHCNSKDLNFKPFLGLIYVCRDCGWQGTMAVEDKEGQDV